MQNAGKFDDLMRQGLALHQNGQMAEAEALYRKVLAKIPSHAGANHLLGLALLNRAKPQDAVTHLARAVHVRGDDAEYRNNFGVALNAAGRPGDAVAELDRAIALRPNYAAAMNNRGLALKALGRHADAAQSFEAALTLKPAEAGFLNNLGNALTECGDWFGAEKAYRTALDARPAHVGALTALGTVLLQMGRKAEALDVAKAAAAAHPAEPELQRGLGHAYRVAGNAAAAVAAYRALIALRPDDAEAHRLLGGLIRRTSIDADVEGVISLLSRPELADDSRAQLEFALGQALDDMGDHQRAFTHFATGNALVAKLRPYDRAADAAAHDEVLQFFESLPDDRIPPLEPPTGPILIVGLPRSGKSSLEGRLARHPALSAGDELPFLDALVTRMRAGRALHDIKPHEFRALGESYLNDLSRLAPGRRVIDTMPNNYRLVGLLRLALPSARVLYCTREPLAHGVALFQKYFAKDGNAYASDLSDIAIQLARYDALMALWEARLSGFVRRDDSAATEGAMRQTLAFLGLPSDAACVAPHESEPRIGEPQESSPQQLLPYAAGLSAGQRPKN